MYLNVNDSVLQRNIHVGLLAPTQFAVLMLIPFGTLVFFTSQLLQTRGLEKYRGFHVKESQMAMAITGVSAGTAVESWKRFNSG